MEYHIQIFKGEQFYIGFCEEVPGAMTQGATIDEVRENMKDAIALMLKPVIPNEFTDQTPIRETLVL